MKEPNNYLLWKDRYEGILRSKYNELKEDHYPEA